jgi:hypothetical protein
MKILIYLLQKHFEMRTYFLNISEEEKKSIREKQRNLYDGYKTLQPEGNMTPLNVENLAMDSAGITVNNKGEVMNYTNTGINQPMKSRCNECGEVYEGDTCECMSNMYENKSGVCEMCDSEMKEGKMCECGGAGVKYSMEEIEESIKVKSKKGQVYNQINESLDWFRKFNKY